MNLRWYRYKPSPVGLFSWSIHHVVETAWIWCWRFVKFRSKYWCLGITCKINQEQSKQVFRSHWLPSYIVFTLSPTGLSSDDANWLLLTWLLRVDWCKVCDDNLLKYGLYGDDRVSVGQHHLSCLIGRSVHNHQVTRLVYSSFQEIVNTKI